MILLLNNTIPGPPAYIPQVERILPSLSSKRNSSAATIFCGSEVLAARIGGVTKK
jgi:hypothetical protein